MTEQNLFRVLTDLTAIDRFLESFGENGERVLVGNSQITDNYSMATSFYKAAEELRIIAMAKMGCDLFRCEYPMLFLYRHAIELYIKSVLPAPKRGHNLEKLLDLLIRHVNGHFDVDITNGWFTTALREFSSIDPSSQAFRYPSDLAGSSTMSGDFFINLKELGETMNRVSHVFSYIYLVRDKMRQQTQPAAPMPISPGI